MRMSYNRYDKDGYAIIWSNKKKGRPRVAVVKDKKTGDLYVGFEGFLPQENLLRDILHRLQDLKDKEVGDGTK